MKNILYLYKTIDWVEFLFFILLKEKMYRQRKMNQNVILNFILPVLMYLPMTAL